MTYQVNDPYLSGNSPPNINVGSTDLSSVSPSDMFGTATGYAPPNVDITNADLGTLSGTDMFGSSPTSAAANSTATTPDWLTQLASLSSESPSPSGSGSSTLSSLWNWLQSKGSQLSGLGPYAAVAGIGMSQAKQAQQDAQQKANTLAALGSPYISAGQDLLKQFQSGQIRPDQQAVATLAQQQGQTLIDSGSALSAIAQQAYQDYQSGKLPAADEQQLQNQVAAQKQELRQRLSQQGIADSSILAGYDQQVENQAMITRQQLLDARFATGNQAYDEWLKSTTQGQQLKLQGAQFASQALDTMLSESLGLGSEGMQPVESAVQLAIQSDQQLSQQVSDLLGNLAAAYAYTVSGPGRGGGAGGGGAGSGGGGGGTMSSIIGNAGKLYNLYNSFAGSFSTAGGAAAAADAAVDAAVAPTIASDSATIAAGNEAWLAAQPAASGALYGGAADAAATGAADAGAAGAADAASTAGLSSTAGAVTAVAAPLALALYASQTNPVDAGAQTNSQLQQATQKILSTGINANNVGDAQQLLSSLWSWSNSGDAYAKQWYNQLSQAWDQYTNNVMQQRALAAGFSSVDAMNAAANASAGQRSGRGGATKGTVNA
jgi:hypothetical protein